MARTDQDLNGQIVIVTGANSGVGRSATELLAEAGAHVVMVCRDAGRGEAARGAVRAATDSEAIDLELADISDLDQVRALGARLRDRFDRIDVLINNAGVWRNRLERTGAGHEVTMATNHLGHFLLTNLLLEPLKVGEGRVVNLSSQAHESGDLRRAPLEEIMTGEAWKGGLKAYSDSKLANVLFTLELVRRHGEDGIASNAVHPGVLATRIWNKSRSPISLIMRAFKPLMGRPAVGGRAVFRLAADPALAGVTGRYFRVETEKRAQPLAYDENLARELWETSERLTAS